MLTQLKQHSSATDNSLENNKSTLLEKIGGEDTLDKLSVMLYVKVMTDDELKKNFLYTDQLSQITYQKNFISHFLDGPETSRGKEFKESQCHLHLKQADFDKIVDHFKTIMEELEIDEKLISKIMAIVRETRITA